MQSRVYFTNKKYEWFKAKNQCTLLRNKRSIAHSHLPTGLGWTNYAAKYLPWVDYLGKYVNTFIHLIEVSITRYETNTCTCIDHQKCLRMSPLLNVISTFLLHVM